LIARFGGAGFGVMLPEGQHFSRAHASRSDRQPLITALSKKNCTARACFLRHSDNGGPFLHGQGESAHLKGIRRSSIELMMHATALICWDRQCALFSCFVHQDLVFGSS
jgi:hypothetical protein